MSRPTDNPELPRRTPCIGIQLVDPLAQLLAGLKGWLRFLRHLHGLPAPRIPPGPGVATLYGKCAEPPQYDSLATRQRACHFVEKRRDEPLDISECQVRIVFRHRDDEFRTCHDIPQPAS